MQSEFWRHRAVFTAIVAQEFSTFQLLNYLLRICVVKICIAFAFAGVMNQALPCGYQVSSRCKWYILTGTQTYTQLMKHQCLCSVLQTAWPEHARLTVWNSQPKWGFLWGLLKTGMLQKQFCVHCPTGTKERTWVMQKNGSYNHACKFRNTEKISWNTYNQNCKVGQVITVAYFCLAYTSVLGQTTSLCWPTTNWVTCNQCRIPKHTDAIGSAGVLIRKKLGYDYGTLERVWVQRVKSLTINGFVYNLYW